MPFLRTGTPVTVKRVLAQKATRRLAVFTALVVAAGLLITIEVVSPVNAAPAYAGVVAGPPQLPATASIGHKKDGGINTGDWAIGAGVFGGGAAAAHPENHDFLGKRVC